MYDVYYSKCLISSLFEMYDVYVKKTVNYHYLLLVYIFSSILYLKCMIS